MKIHILDLHFLEKTEAIAAFLVVGKTGVSLVETGAHSTFPQLETEVKKHGFQISDIKKVFLSHIHFDHAGAAWAIAEQSGAQIFVHPKGLPHLAAPEKLYNSARQIYGSDMERLWGEMRAIPENQLVAPAHGEIIESGGVHFRAWHTPGHAVHHIAWEVSEPGAPSERLGRAGHSRPVVFTGDVGGVKIGRRGIAVPPCPPPDVNIEDWLASIELLRNLPVETFYLTHFGKITDKKQHLADLERRLVEYADWMKPHFENQTPQSEIVPLFKKYLQDELRAHGVGKANLEKYEAANPSFMAVAGLMRYWFKKSR